jgi:predicted RNA binding protein YcfA (HicA-like mRNA interferase family)
MKRTDLIRHLAQHGCQFLREGGRHSVYWNPSNRLTAAVPRHIEIVLPVAHRVCRDLGIPKPGA